MPDASLSAADVQDVAATDGRVPEPHKREPYSGDSDILTPTSSHCASHASQMWLPARVDTRTGGRSRETAHACRPTPKARCPTVVSVSTSETASKEWLP